MIFAVKHCESIVHEESAHKEKLTNIIVVEARVACNNVGVMVLAVENESIGRAADFGALLGRVRRCRRLGGGETTVSCDWACTPGDSTLIWSESEAV